MSKTNGLLGVLIRIVIIPWLNRFVKFRWRKDVLIWLFLMQLSLRLGGVLAADVSAGEVAVDMVLGDAGKYLIGILVATIMHMVAGKHIIKLLFLQVEQILCPTVKYFAFLATKTLALTADAD